MGFVSVVSTLLLVSVVYSSDQWIDMNNKLTGKVIHVESIREGWRGFWWKVERLGGFLRIAGISERLVYFEPKSQFLVKQCDSGTVCLEVVAWRDWYLYNVGLGPHAMRAHYPNNKKRLQYKISCWKGDLKECRFNWVYSPNEYSHATTWGGTDLVRGGPYDTRYSRWRILAPTPTERYQVVYSIENRNKAAATHTVKYMVGIEKSKEVTNSITTAVSFEVQKAFVTVSATASASLSHTWKQVDSSVFKQSQEFSLKIPVQPHTKVELKALTGTYGPFTVSSKYYIITCMDLKTGKPCTVNVVQDESTLGGLDASFSTEGSIRLPGVDLADLLYDVIQTL